MHVIMFRLRTRLREGGAYSPWPMRLARITWLIFGVLFFGLMGYVVYLHVPLAEADADGVRLTARSMRELARLALSVDKRKYDAARTLASFGQVARDEVNLEALTGRLVGVVQETMQPEHVSLWVSEPVRSGSIAARAGEGKR